MPRAAKPTSGVIARVPLDEGSLAATLTLDARFPDDDWRSKHFGPENLAPTVERVERIKADLPPGLPLPEAALRFILGSPDVATTIVGMPRISHVEENCAVSEKRALPPRIQGTLRRHRRDRTPGLWSD